MYRQYITVHGCKHSKADIKPTVKDEKDGGEMGLNNGDMTDSEHMDRHSEIRFEFSEFLDTIGNQVNRLDQYTQQRKLVLHFDIRNTVLVADSVTNVAVEQALNSFLTGVVWGKEGDDGQWVWHSDKLSLTPPADDTMTFYKYLEGQFVQNTNDRTRLRIATGDFTQSDMGEIFLQHFKNHLELLKWKHDYKPEEHQRLTMAGNDGQPYNYIVPAVYKCIHHLIKTKRDFTVVFRTYGLDAPNVINSLAYGLQGNHPGYPEPANIAVNEHVGNVTRSEKEPIVFEEFSDSDPSNSTTFTGDRAIYDMLCNKTGISGFRDDVNYWLNNGYHHQTAKPHIIDPFDSSVHHIFFDDNIRTFEDDSIVDLRLFESRGAKDARSLTKTEVAQFDNVCMVQADLISCIENENYYLDRIQECEANYSKFLIRWNKLSRSISHQVPSRIK